MNFFFLPDLNLTNFRNQNILLKWWYNQYTAYTMAYNTNINPRSQKAKYEFDGF